MAPFASSPFRLKNALATLISLKNGSYNVNTDRAIDNMSKRIYERGDTPVPCVGVPPDATMGELRGYMVSSQDRILLAMADIETLAKNTEDCNNILKEIVDFTKWRLNYDTIATIVLGALSIAGFATKRKFAGVVGLVAAAISAISFLDELDIRSVELNEQFDCLRELCNATADSLIDFLSRRNSHNFMFDLFSKRFGESFTDPEPDEEALNEVYAEDDGEIS